MFNTVKTIINSIGGTLFLFLIGVLSLCGGLKLLMLQASGELSGNHITLLALVLVLVTTLITNKLLFGNKKEEIKDYSKEIFEDEDNLDELVHNALSKNDSNIKRSLSTEEINPIEDLDSYYDKSENSLKKFGENDADTDSITNTDGV